MKVLEGIVTGAPLYVTIFGEEEVHLGSDWKLGNWRRVSYCVVLVCCLVEETKERGTYNDA